MIIEQWRDGWDSTWGPIPFSPEVFLVESDIPGKQRNPGYVYLLRADSYYKIGASKNVQRRIVELQTASPIDLQLVCSIYTWDLFGLESRLHKLFAHKQTRGDWFELDTGEVEYIRELPERNIVGTPLIRPGADS